MLILLDKKKVKIAALTQLKDFSIKERINSEEVLTFSLFLYDENNKLIEEECYVETKDQRYIVKAIKRQSTAILYECRLDIYDLKSHLHLEGFENTTIDVLTTVQQAIAGTDWTAEAPTLPPRRRSLKLEPLSAYDVIRKAISKFGCEVRFKTKEKKVIIAETFGEDRGVYFSDQLNLKSLNTVSDTIDFATRLYAYGKDGLTFAEINNGNDYVEDFEYTDKIVSTVWIDKRYTDVESLFEDAKAKLKEMARPKKSYEVDIKDLAAISTEYNFLNYSLGDVVTLVSNRDKFRDKQRIVEMITYPLEPSRNSATISNISLTFEELQRRNEEMSNKVEDAFNEDGTIDGGLVEGLKTENTIYYTNDLPLKIGTTKKEIFKNVVLLKSKVDAILTVSLCLQTSIVSDIFFEVLVNGEKLIFTPIHTLNEGYSIITFDMPVNKLDNTVQNIVVIRSMLSAGTATIEANQMNVIIKGENIVDGQLSLIPFDGGEHTEIVNIGALKPLNIKNTFSLVETIQVPTPINGSYTETVNIKLEDVNIIT